MEIKDLLIESESIEDVSNNVNLIYQKIGIIQADVLAYLIQKIINKLINGYFIQKNKILVDKKNIKVIKYYSRVLKNGFSCCPDIKFDNLEKKIKKIKQKLNELLNDDIKIEDIVLSNLNKEDGTFEMNISLKL